MARRHLWEINCFGLDAVLCTSFNPDELLSLDPALRMACDIPEHPGLVVPRSLIVFGVTHKACHSDNPTSRKIEWRLDAMHKRALDETEGMDKIDVITHCYAVAEEAGEDLAGCLWTVLTDPRPELRQQGDFWMQGLMIRSLLHWIGSWKALREKRSYFGGTERNQVEGAGG